MLEDVAYSVGLAWGKIIPTTIAANCWKKCIGNDDIMVDEMKLIPFSKQDVKAVFDALSTNLQAGDLASWIEVDETPVTQHLSEEAIATSVKNGKKTGGLGANDTRIDSENNGDDSCEVVVPKLSKVLENINEVMTRLEQQTDSEHLHLLHLVNIKKYVLKEYNHQFLQTTLHDNFHKEA
jgi:hypothetical protein